MSAGSGQEHEDTRTSMEHIINITTTLGTLREQELTGIATLYEKPTTASDPESGMDAKPAYITQGKESERTLLLITRSNIYREFMNLNYWIVRLPERYARARKEIGVILAKEMTKLLMSMVQEAEALKATLLFISPRNKLTLNLQLDMIGTVDKALDQVCQMVLAFGSSA
ncbi:hypothetical protein BGX23_011142 [Mortierella sp. AD031]|nr:hypothetical protein BGX23_011142 [Mortierella sp. AD031]